MERAEVVGEVCRAISKNANDEAASLLRRDYPFVPAAVTKRKYGPIQSTKVFVRDGFRDRYTGDRLVFPPVLRVLTTVLPNEFPCHPNWRKDVTHPA